MPVKDKCPRCGGLVLHKKGKDFVYCYDKTCGYQEKRETEPDTEEKQGTENSEE
jgi:uncharacterized C2H2 Zn-finger protein